MRSLKVLKKFNRQDWAVVFCILLLAGLALGMLVGLVACQPSTELIEYERRYNEAFPNTDTVVRVQQQDTSNLATREAVYAQVNTSQSSYTVLIETPGLTVYRIVDREMCQVIYMTSAGTIVSVPMWDEWISLEDSAKALGGCLLYD